MVKTHVESPVYKQNLKTKAISKNIHFHIMEGISEFREQARGIFELEFLGHPGF